MILFFAGTGLISLWAIESEPLVQLPVNEQEAIPEAVKSINENEARIEIKTSIPGVEVYLDNVYYGRSNLTIKDLKPGYYKLELVKEGYESETVYISVKNGCSKKFSFEMRRIYGTVEIHNIPENAYVYISNYEQKDINGAFYSTKIVPGRYEVRICKFGYKDYVENVDVVPYGIVSVYPEMTEADFALMDFYSGRVSFNPNYKNFLGKVDFGFFVTANEPVEAVIYNDDGDEVFAYYWDSFITWQQFFTWDGRDWDGNILADGLYTIVLSSAHFEYSQQVEIDSTITYPIVSPGKIGGGIGNLPSLFGDVTDYGMPYIQVGPSFYNDESFDFHGVDFSFGFTGSLGNHFEGSLNYSMSVSDEYKHLPIQFSAGIKLFDKLYLNSIFSLCYGGIIRYGFMLDREGGNPGFDNGCGLGGGLLVSLDSKRFDAGLSSQFVFGAVDGMLNRNEQLWVNGLTFSVKPTALLRLNGWCGLNAVVGGDSIFGLDTGGEILYMMETMPVILNVKAGVKLIFDGISSFYGTIGFAYLF